jgi:F-type H+-transporting ATPase subunit b
MLLSLVFGTLASLTVQPPVLAAQSASADVAGGEKALKTEETKSESEETDKYRHSATVQWVSNLIHVDVETTAKGFEYINFIIVILAVGIPLVKILPKVFRKRSETLSQDLQSARTATEEAKVRLTAVEAKLAGLDSEIAAIRKQVEEEMVADEARSKAAIQEESARIVAAAEQEIAVAGALEQRGLRQFAADLAIERALTKLTFDTETDRALIAEFAASGKAGQN